MRFYSGTRCGREQLHMFACGLLCSPSLFRKLSVASSLHRPLVNNSKFDMPEPADEDTPLQLVN
jgi:hypothetical protein